MTGASSAEKKKKKSSSSSSSSTGIHRDKGNRNECDPIIIKH